MNNTNVAAFFLALVAAAPSTWAQAASSAGAADGDVARTECVKPREDAGRLFVGAKRRLFVTLSALPPVRLRLSLDNVQGMVGDHAELDWEPALSSRLTRSVVLKPGCWQVSFTTDQLPAPPSTSAAKTLDYYVLRFAFTNKTTADVTANVPYGVFTRLDEKLDTAISDGRPKLYIQFSLHDLPTLADATSAFSAAEGGTVGGRSFDEAASKAATDLLEILAEIAFDRARSKAFSLISDKAVSLVCTDLKLSLGLDAPKSAIALLTTLAPANVFSIEEGRLDADLLLPNTCQALQHLRLQDLATAGVAVQRALQQDVLWLAMRIVFPRLKNADQVDLATALASAGALVADAIAAKPRADNTAAAVFVVGLSQRTWGSDSGFSCGVRLAFAVAAQCYGSSRCDARAIADRTKNADGYFNAADPCIKLLADVRERWPDLDEVVARSLDVVDPPKGMKGRQQVRLAVDLALDLVERHDKIDDAVRQDLRDLRRILDGSLDVDLQPVLLGAAGLLQRKLNDPATAARLGKTSQIVAAVVTYSSTYATDPKGDPARLAAAKQARKQAVESLIDASTDRSQRGGDWVVSLGANVGLNVVGTQQLLRESNTETALPQLEIPIGAALQYLPNVQRNDFGWLRRHAGFHLQVSVVDPAQFVALSSSAEVTATKWNSFVTLDGQVGMILGSGSSPFVVGLEARFAPTLFPRESGQPPTPDTHAGGLVRYGVFASYYVPFFDFN